MRLFAERAAAVRPGFDVDEELLAEVVRGLDGKAAQAEVGPARLRRAVLPARGSAAPADLPAQARRP